MCPRSDLRHGMASNFTKEEPWRTRRILHSHTSPNCAETSQDEFLPACPGVPTGRKVLMMPLDCPTSSGIRMASNTCGHIGGDAHITLLRSGMQGILDLYLLRGIDSAQASVSGKDGDIESSREGLCSSRILQRGRCEYLHNGQWYSLQICAMRGPRATGRRSTGQGRGPFDHPEQWRSCRCR